MSGIIPDIAIRFEPGFRGKEQDSLITHREENEIVVVTITGDLNESTSIDFREYMNSLLADAHYRIIIDLDGVGYMTSLGIGVLCDMSKRTAREDGWIKLSGPNEELKDIFTFTMLTDIFNIYETVDQALEDA